MDEGIGMAEAKLGLPGLRVLKCDPVAGDAVIRVEPRKPKGGVSVVSTPGWARDPVEVQLRDAHCLSREFGGGVANVLLGRERRGGAFPTGGDEVGLRIPRGF